MYNFVNSLVAFRGVLRNTEKARFRGQGTRGGAMWKIGRFCRLTAPQRRALCEAWLCLAAAQGLVGLLPYRLWAKTLGPVRHFGDPEALPAHRASIAEVAWAVETAARHLPWRPVCLPRAMAAKWMLERRNVPSTLHLGIGRTADADPRFGLHAWLSAGGEAVVGGDVASQFTVLALFGPRLSRTPANRRARQPNRTSS